MATQKLHQSQDPFKPPSNLQQSQYSMLRESIWKKRNRKDKDFLLDSP